MKTIINVILKNKVLFITTVLLSVIIGFTLGQFNKNTLHNHSENEPHNQADKQTWTCSMHPQIKQYKPGLCPICAMELVPLSTMNNNDELLDPNEIQMTESALALASVQTTVVKKGFPEKNIQLLGKVKADERNIAQLTARFGGRIESLNINYTGQQVNKGELLGTIYSPELISAQKELLEATKFKDNNPSFYKASRNKLKLWNLTETQIDAIETLGETKSFFDIQSPISGTVTKRHIAIGDYVKEGSALFEVINLNQVWVQFEAYESDLPWIKKGDQIDFNIQSLPGKYFEGKVTFIDPFIDAQTRVAQVRVELNNPKMALKPEMFANGILKSKTASNANELLIPKLSILWTGKRAVVYVKIPDRETTTFIYREIVLGPEAGNFYVVSKGLSEGEEIATNGVFKIDAAAQLASKTSMMNPNAGQTKMKDMPANMKMGDDTKPIEKNNVAEATVAYDKFKVSGNCSMCKTTIENAVNSLAGINSVDWNIESKQLEVSYNTKKVSVPEIHKTIAKAGYDTELEKGDDSAYNNLPACCKYTRE